jgi:hypothetical protein
VTSPPPGSRLPSDTPKIVQSLTVPVARDSAVGAVKMLPALTTNCAAAVGLLAGREARTRQPRLAQPIRIRFLRNRNPRFRRKLTLSRIRNEDTDHARQAPHMRGNTCAEARFFIQDEQWFKADHVKAG